MQYGIITLACLLLLVLAPVIPGASAQDEPYGSAEASLGAPREEPTLVAYRHRHCYMNFD
jgi:hypothetical protein